MVTPDPWEDLMQQIDNWKSDWIEEFEDQLQALTKKEEIQDE